MRPRVHSEAQLVAVTRRLVRATWLLVIVGFLFFGASVAQFFILRSSDQKTDKVISAMQRQATIMKGQLDEMGRQIAITEAQLRPRMSLTFEPSGDLKDGNGGKSLNGRIVTPVWKNSGSVPPDELVGWVHIRTFDGDAPFGSPDAFHLGREDAPLERLSVLSPNAYEQGGTMINEGDLQRVLGRTGQVIAWGYMQYRDPFPNAPVHHLNWCYKLSLVLTESGRKGGWLPYSPDCNRSD